MKRLISVLLILMMLIPAACAESDYYYQTGTLKTMYEVSAIMSGLPKISTAVELEQGVYYFQETGVILFLNAADITGFDDTSHFMGCMTTENTKMDDFLLTCACALKTMNRQEDDIVLYGHLLDVYIKCRNKYPAPFVEQGTIYLMMRREDDNNYTFVVRAK